MAIMGYVRECVCSGKMHIKHFSGCYLFSNFEMRDQIISQSCVCAYSNSTNTYSEREMEQIRYNVEKWGKWRYLCEGYMGVFCHGLATFIFKIISK